MALADAQGGHRQPGRNAAIQNVDMRRGGMFAGREIDECPPPAATGIARRCGRGQQDHRQSRPQRGTRLVNSVHDDRGCGEHGWTFKPFRAHTDDDLQVLEAGLASSSDPTSELADTTDRLEQALERIALLAQRRQEVSDDHGGGVELAAQLDVMIARLRAALGDGAA
jgi:hypothetical protein